VTDVLCESCHLTPRPEGGKHTRTGLDYSIGKEIGINSLERRSEEKTRTVEPPKGANTRKSFSFFKPLSPARKPEVPRCTCTSGIARLDIHECVEGPLDQGNSGIVEQTLQFLLGQSLIGEILCRAPSTMKALANKSTDCHPSSFGGTSDAFAFFC